MATGSKQIGNDIYYDSSIVVVPLNGSDTTIQLEFTYRDSVFKYIMNKGKYIRNETRNFSECTAMGM